MKISVTYELVTFAYMLLLGIVSGVIFDFFRVLRKNIPKTFAIVAISDALFWGLSAVCFFWMIWHVTYGELRVYMFIGISLGIIFYFLLLTKTIIWAFTALFKFFLTIFKLIFKILLTPLKFLDKMLLETFIGFLKKLFGCLKKFLRKSRNKRNDEKAE